MVMTKPRNPIQLGLVGAAHGIRGEVRVKPFTEDPMSFGGYGPLFTADGRALKVAAIRPAGNSVIVRFDGVNDRNAAEALKGEALFVDRSALPQELDEEEFYHADLMGLPVIDESGQEIGKVEAIHDFGAGDILDIRPARGPTIMVPFTREAVPEIDLAKGFLRVDSVAAGLKDDAEADAQDGPEWTAHSRGSRTAGENN